MAEVARQVRHCREKQIPEAVALQAAAVRKPVLKQPGQQQFIFGERDHAAADVARRQNIELAAQPSGAAAVISHSNDGCYIDQAPAHFGVALKPAQERGQAAAAAYRHNSQGSR